MHWAAGTCKVNRVLGTRDSGLLGTSAIVHLVLRSSRYIWMPHVTCLPDLAMFLRPKSKNLYICLMRRHKTFKMEDILVGPTLSKFEKGKQPLIISDAVGNRVQITRLLEGSYGYTQP